MTSDIPPKNVLMYYNNNRLLYPYIWYNITNKTWTFGPYAVYGLVRAVCLLAYSSQSHVYLLNDIMSADMNEQECV